VKWFRKAAERGDTRAQHNLAGMYFIGDGVKKDRVWAYAWILRAAADGDELAMVGRDIIAKEMTEEQITNAQKVSYVLCASIPGCER
jgi:TPR repeat protein